MLSEMYQTLTKPLREEMPLSQLALYVLLYAVLAWVAFDATRIVGSYIKSAVD